MPRLSVDLHFTIERERDVFVGTCDELDIASHGDSAEEATSRYTNATNLYLEVLAHDGELYAVLKSRGLVPQANQDTEANTEHFLTTSRLLVNAGS